MRDDPFWWDIRDDGRIVEDNANLTENTVAQVYGDDPEHLKDRLHLFFAAPDMLEALEAMVNPGHPGPPNIEQVVAARAAIAKAKGES